MKTSNGIKKTIICYSYFSYKNNFDKIFLYSDKTLKLKRVGTINEPSNISFLHFYCLLYTHTHIYIYIYTHTYVHTHIHTHAHIHTYIHTHTPIYIYIYTHVHTHKHTFILQGGTIKLSP